LRQGPLTYGHTTDLRTLSISYDSSCIWHALNHVFLSEFWWKHRRKNPGLALCQIRTATAKLVSPWARGDHCSQRCAEQIGARLALTQQRNAKAARSHQRRSIARLHAMGIKLKTIAECHWKSL